MNSRSKGARGERLLAQFLRDHGYGDAKRGQQRSGLEQADVVDGPDGWHLECKWVEKLNIWNAVEQAKRDAKDKNHVVAMKRNKSDWLAVLPLGQFVRMVRMLELLYPDYRREL